MNRIIREQRPVVVQRWNSATKAMDTIKTCVVEISVDMDGLFLALGQSAAQNKTGRSIEASGWVVAKVVKQ